MTGGSFDLPSRNKVRLRLVGVELGVAVLCVGIWGFVTQAVGMRITDCGFDAKGAYAKVRVNNLLFGAYDQEMWVDFYLDGNFYTYEGRSAVRVPAHERFTTVLRAQVLPPGVRSGRRFYVAHGQFVTRRYAKAHPVRTLTEVVPDASHTISCRFDHTDPD